MAIPLNDLQDVRRTGQCYRSPSAGRWGSWQLPVEDVPRPQRAVAEGVLTEKGLEAPRRVLAHPPPARFAHRGEGLPALLRSGARRSLANATVQHSAGCHRQRVGINKRQGVRVAVGEVTAKNNKGLASKGSWSDPTGTDTGITFGIHDRARAYRDWRCFIARCWLCMAVGTEEVVSELPRTCDLEECVAQQAGGMVTHYAGRNERMYPALAGGLQRSPGHGAAHSVRSLFYASREGLLFAHSTPLFSDS